MFLACSYFFGNLSLNVLIDMVLIKKRVYFIAYGALSLFLSIVFKTFKQIEASLVSHVIFAIDYRDLFADFTAYLTFAHL